MAVALRFVGVSPGAQATTCVIVKPVGLMVGDLMIAHVANRTVSAISSTPSGFTSIRVDPSAADVVVSNLYYKVADAADVAGSDFTFTFAATEYNMGAIAAFTGFDDAAPINTHNGAGCAAQGATITSPEITPTVAGCLICLFCTGNAIATYSGYAIVTSNPGSWTEAYDILWDNAVPISLALGIATRPQTSATGNGTATASTSQYWTGQLVAITPALEVCGASKNIVIEAVLTGLI